MEESSHGLSWLIILDTVVRGPMKTHKISGHSTPGPVFLPRISSIQTTRFTD